MPESVVKICFVIILLSNKQHLYIINLGGFLTHFIQS